MRTGSYGNPGLKPEKGQETEIGFDADLFESRVGIEFTHYDKEMRDVLVSTSMAPSTGFRGTQQANLGAVTNKGIELALSATPLQLKNFDWDARLSLSTNKNKLLAFGDTSIHQQTPPSQSYGAVQQHRVGYPLGGLLGPVPKRNADGTLALVNGAITLGDTVYIGPAMPTREMAFSNTLRSSRTSHSTRCSTTRGATTTIAVRNCIAAPRRRTASSATIRTSPRANCRSIWRALRPTHEPSTSTRRTSSSCATCPSPTRFRRGWRRALPPGMPR